MFYGEEAFVKAFDHTTSVADNRLYGWAVAFLKDLTRAAQHYAIINNAVLWDLNTGLVEDVLRA